MHRFSVRTLLVLLVLAVALPPAALLLHITRLRVEARTELVRELARGAADGARAVADGMVEDARELLARLAPGDGAGRARLAHDELTAGTTVAMTDASGSVLCSAGAPAAVAGASLAQDAGFRRVLETRASVVGDFAQS